MLVYPENQNYWDHLPQASAAVCTVNCVGIMGKGIALEFRNRFPNMYQVYRHSCWHGVVLPGGVIAYSQTDRSPRYLYLAATKDHWRSPSKLEWVDNCLKEIALLSQGLRPSGLNPNPVVLVPALGCANGHLYWRDVRPLVEKNLTPVQSVDFYVFPPESPNQ